MGTFLLCQRDPVAAGPRTRSFRVPEPRIPANLNVPISIWRASQRAISVQSMNCFSISCAKSACFSQPELSDCMSMLWPSGSERMTVSIGRSLRQVPRLMSLSSTWCARPWSAVRHTHSGPSASSRRRSCPCISCPGTPRGRRRTHTARTPGRCRYTSRRQSRRTCRPDSTAGCRPKVSRPHTAGPAVFPPSAGTASRVAASAASAKMGTFLFF